MAEINIIEAIKSGKPFKREIHSEWFDAEPGISEVWITCDVLADDWEIKDEDRFFMQKITKCHDCLERVHFSGDIICAIEERTLYGTYNIPDWCPKLEGNK